MTRQSTLGFISVAILSLCFLIELKSRGNIYRDNTPPIQLTVSAAVSLKEAMEEIKSIYEQKQPETEIIYNFAASGSLQRQIEQGSPVDIFISAASEQMDALEKQGLLQTRRNLLKNQLVLVTPNNYQKTKRKIESFTDLAQQEVNIVALGEPNSVPAGKYAQEVLNFWKIADEINYKAVYAKDVRQVLNYIETTNADAGIVYLTDVQAAENVQIVATAPEISHSPIIYPVAIIKNSYKPTAAIKLFEFLHSPSAQAVFAKYGFSLVIDQ